MWLFVICGIIVVLLGWFELLAVRGIGLFALLCYGYCCFVLFLFWLVGWCCCFVFIVLLELLTFVVMVIRCLCFDIVVLVVWFTCLLFGVGCILLIVLLICAVAVVALGEWFWLVCSGGCLLLFADLGVFGCGLLIGFCLVVLLLWAETCWWIGLYCGFGFVSAKFDLELWFVIWVWWLVCLDTFHCVGFVYCCFNCLCVVLLLMLLLVWFKILCCCFSAVTYLVFVWFEFLFVVFVIWSVAFGWLFCLCSLLGFVFLCLRLLIAWVFNSVADLVWFLCYLIQLFLFSCFVFRVFVYAVVCCGWMFCIC